MGRQRLRPALHHARRQVRKIPAELPPPVGDDPAFVMLVKTDNAGVSASDQMQLTGAAGTYTVDWGDGVVEELTGVQTHTYPAPGEYTIRITGGMTSIRFNNGGDKLKLLDIQNWGDIAWTLLSRSFMGCKNLTGTATDAPDLSLITDLGVTFYDCPLFNMDISGWDVSTITNMANMFVFDAAFNSNLSNWDTGNVTAMNQMFANASNFNSDISGWNTVKVTNMNATFQSATAFNQNLGGWNMAAVTIAGNMLNLVTLSPTNYGATLIGWATQTLKPNLSFHGGNSKYPTDGTGNPATDAAAARAKIIADFGWTILDGGPE